MSPLPVIHTRGDHFQVGYQIGIAARGSLQKMYAETRAAYADKWARLLEASRAFRDATETQLPRVLAEMRGCAEGAQVPFAELFLMSVEELLYEEVRGCTDLAAVPPATADGEVWLAHNNDLGRSAQQHLFVTCFRAEGEPEILAVTVGGWFISIGFNRAGISLTGNQLTANDARVGVPRLLVVRDILAQGDFDAAVRAALLPARASSYNNLLASRDGRAVNVEGSATAYALLWAEGGVTCHTNHYLAEKMRGFEAARHELKYSAARHSRAASFAEKYRGRIAREVCELFLRDHVFAPWSVCRHAGQSVTVFSAIVNLTAQQMWLARGNPCQNAYALYAFDGLAA